MKFADDTIVIIQLQTMRINTVQLNAGKKVHSFVHMSGADEQFFTGHQPSKESLVLKPSFH